MEDLAESALHGVFASLKNNEFVNENHMAEAEALAAQLLAGMASIAQAADKAREEYFSQDAGQAPMGTSRSLRRSASDTELSPSRGQPAKVRITGKQKSQALLRCGGGQPGVLAAAASAAADTVVFPMALAAASLG